MKKRSRPPVSLMRSEASTSRSATARWDRTIGPGLEARKYRAPVRTAHLKMARRAGLASWTRAMTAAYIFS